MKLLHVYASNVALSFEELRLPAKYIMCDIFLKLFVANKTPSKIKKIFVVIIF